MITKDNLEIPVDGADVDLAIDSSLFKNWFNSLDDTFTIKKITIQSVDIVRGKALFIKIKVMVVTDGVEHGLVTFLHHDVVFGLCILTCEEVRYVVVVHQPRLPVGKRIYELPAGLIDDDTTPESVILRELEEEAGLVTHLGITVSDIKPLFKPNAPLIESPGVMAKYIFPFYLEKQIDRVEFDRINELHTGLKEEHEDIVVKLIPYEQIANYCHDSSSVAALYLYEHRND